MDKHRIEIGNILLEVIKQYDSLIENLDNDRLRDVMYSPLIRPAPFSYFENSDILDRLTSKIVFESIEEFKGKLRQELIHAAKIVKEEFERL